MSFYKRIIKLLPDDLSESEQARTLGVYRQQLRLWRLQDEAGSPVNPSRETIRKIAQRLRASEVYLRDGLGPIDPEKAEAWKRENRTEGGCQCRAI